MVKAAVEMQNFRPDFVLGYSSVLDTFARVNSERRSELRELNVKAVIGAAEGFPFFDSVAHLEDLFNAPVAMEYGSVETNLIAHTRKTGGYEVFWWRYLVELGTSKSPLGGQIAYVTSLYPRCFPLIRYELGDELVCNSASDHTVGIHEFDRVLGRCNDYVTIPSGDSFHSELFTHAVRGCKQVLGYQLQQSSSEVILALKPGPDFDKSVILRIKYSLLNVDRRLEAVRIVTVADLIRTRAGKTPMVVRL
jgi:phenylacetate-coenzyme A ligase PaaK-like adenylate-forming protein